MYNWLRVDDALFNIVLQEYRSTNIPVVSCIDT